MDGVKSMLNFVGSEFWRPKTVVDRVSKFAIRLYSSKMLLYLYEDYGLKFYIDEDDFMFMLNENRRYSRPTKWRKS